MAEFGQNLKQNEILPIENSAYSIELDKYFPSKMTDIFSYSSIFKLRNYFKNNITIIFIASLEETHGKDNDSILLSDILDNKDLSSGHNNQITNPTTNITKSASSNIPK